MCDDLDCFDTCADSVLEHVVTAYVLIFAYFCFVGLSVGHYAADLRFQTDLLSSSFLDAYLAFSILSTIAFFTVTAFLWFWAARFSLNGQERKGRTMNGLLVMFAVHDCPFFFLEVARKTSTVDGGTPSTPYGNFVFAISVIAFGCSFLPAWLHFLMHASEFVEKQLCRVDGEIVSFEQEVFAGAVEEFGQYDPRSNQYVVATAAQEAKVRAVMELVRRCAMRGTLSSSSTLNHIYMSSNRGEFAQGDDDDDDDDGGRVQAHKTPKKHTHTFGTPSAAAAVDSYSAIISPPKELLGHRAGEDYDEEASPSRWNSVLSPVGKFNEAGAGGGTALWTTEAVLSPPSLVVERLRHEQAKAEEAEKDANKQDEEEERTEKGDATTNLRLAPQGKSSSAQKKPRRKRGGDGDSSDGIGGGSVSD